MRKFFSYVTFLGFFFFVLWIPPTKAEPSNKEVEVITQLISYIKQSRHTFVRNGEVFDSEAAAKHIADKYDYYKASVSTADEFIARCASSSKLSGKPYLVRLEGGAELSVRTWLGDELRRIRQSTNNTDKSLTSR